MTDKMNYDLGTYKQRTYLIRIRADPNFEEVADFAVVVYYKNAERKEQVQIARVDTSHGYAHFDRLYRRDEAKEAVDWGLWETVERFKSKWRRWAESHEQKSE